MKDKRKKDKRKKPFTERFEEFWDRQHPIIQNILFLMMLYPAIAIISAIIAYCRVCCH